jgi:peptidoglycan/LPS O-acetylase OafA/YrhL
MKRIPELDGIRGCAIGLVLICHLVIIQIAAPPATFWSYVQAAGRLTWTGVDLFFVLSGFLIGGILLDTRDSPNYFRSFYRRRFFRIVPIYAVMLSVTWLYVSLAHPAGERLPWLSYIFFVQNFWMAKRETLGFFGVTWSLAVEEQFYVTLPSVICFVSPRYLVRVLVFGILAAPCLRILCFHFWPQQGLAAYVLMPCRADALLLGVLAAIWMRNAHTWGKIKNNGRTLLALLLFFGAGVALITKYVRDPHSLFMVSLGYTWIAVFYLCVILYALTRPESWLARAMRMRWLGALGAIAYGVYLVHWQMMEAMFRLIPGKIAALTAALITTLAVCTLSWHYFEKPLVHLGHKRS